MWLFFFFFFQAEDGIRDLTVTGVQTCALPISQRMNPCRARRRTSLNKSYTATILGEVREVRGFNEKGNLVMADGEEFVRSEERRVGKECRSRWSPYH